MAIARPDLEALKVLVYPEPKLREQAQPIAEVDGFLNEISSRMAELMMKHEGIGLASTQVG